jgi:hypothetical protein
MVARHLFEKAFDLLGLRPQLKGIVTPSPCRPGRTPLRWPRRTAMVAKHRAVVCKRPDRDSKPQPRSTRQASCSKVRGRSPGEPGEGVPCHPIHLHRAQGLKVRRDHVAGPITLRRKRFASCLSPNPDLLELLLQSRVGLKEQILASAALSVLSDTFRSALPPKAGRIFPSIRQRR